MPNKRQRKKLGLTKQKPIEVQVLDHAEAIMQLLLSNGYRLDYEHGRTNFWHSLDMYYFEGADKVLRVQNQTGATPFDFARIMHRNEVNTQHG